MAASYFHNLVVTDFIIFFLGTCVGSFLNSVIFRLNKGESFLFSRSHCPYCGRQLNWQDLVPIFSFLYLKGRCRYCQEKISLQYPLVEFLSGVLFVFSFHSIFSYFEIFSSFLYFSIFLFFHWFLISFLIIIFVYDLRYYIIPDKIIYPGILVAILYRIILMTEQTHVFTPAILSALGAAGFFWTFYFFSQGKWMGLGDVKLAFLLGLYLGFPKILICLIFSFFLGALVGTILILAKKKTLKSKVPFAPFLSTGAFLSLFLGESLISFWKRVSLI